MYYETEILIIGVGSLTGRSAEKMLRIPPDTKRSQGGKI